MILVFCLLAAAALAAWAATLRVHGWAGPSPRYVGVHRGSLVVFSSIWDWPPRRADGKRVEWIYDVVGLKVENGRGPWPRGAFRQMREERLLPGWWPPVRKVGSRYLASGAVPWGRPMWMVEIPLWAFALPCAGVAVVGWRSWRQARRAEAGSCAQCGHDLSGMGSGVCPECGAEGKGREIWAAESDSE